MRNQERSVSPSFAQCNCNAFQIREHGWPSVPTKSGLCLWGCWTPVIAGAINGRQLSNSVNLVKIKFLAWLDEKSGKQSFTIFSLISCFQVHGYGQPSVPTESGFCLWGCWTLVIALGRSLGWSTLWSILVIALGRSLGWSMLWSIIFRPVMQNSSWIAISKLDTKLGHCGFSCNGIAKENEQQSLEQLWLARDSKDSLFPRNPVETIFPVLQTIASMLHCLLSHKKAWLNWFSQSCWN